MTHTNKHYFKRMCRKAGPESESWRTRGILRINVIISHQHVGRGRKKRHGTRLAGAEYRKIASYLTEAMMGDSSHPRPVSGMMCIGGRYMITNNMRVSKGIANSAWVRLVDVILSEDAVVRWDPAGEAHCVDSCQVRGVIVAVPGRSQEQLCAGLPKGQFFVPCTDYNFTFKWRQKEVGKRLRARGPSLVMAHAVTGHKVQGATLEHAVVSNFDAINGRKVALDAGWLYVALSRVSKLSSLLLGTKVLQACLSGAQTWSWSLRG